MTDLDRLARDYRTGILRFLSRRDEEAMTAGYELGRRVAAGEAGLLDVIEVHHRILAALLTEQSPSAPADLTTAAGQFLAEVLSTFAMAHRIIQTPTDRPG